ncbi:hypothetical protein [Achromobacter sp. MFA1 R4]|uniref:hypothetical protein n=1 Tax=Achromobacter sp. MFA1 R4 TaxID=1881016 RepID=UPI0012EBCBC1|nr:hypothetical protein [Achromobacter sp. MFA1 R4]
MPIRIDPRPATALALSQASWDPKGGILSCTIEYPVVADQADKPAYPLRDFLDRQWPEPEPIWIVDAGPLTLDLDDRKRLVEVYLLASPATWTLQPIEPAQGDVAEPYLEAQFDEGGHAKCQPIQEEQYDPQQGIVCLSWGPADHWHIISPTLALGLASDGTLMKIQISEFRLPIPKPRPKSAWERLKHRLMQLKAGTCLQWKSGQMKMRYLSWICRAIWVCFLSWILFMWLCSPIVALHYSSQATESLVFYLYSDGTITKSELAPGKSDYTSTAMNPPSDMQVILSFPVLRREVLHVTEPFSRIDVYIGPGARIERTEIRHDFFARFTDPD